MLGELAVVIVGYARSSQILDLIEVSITAGVRNVIVWMDGPADGSVKESQTLLISRLEEIRHSLGDDVNLEVYRAKQNFGSGVSVLAATSFMFDRFKYGLILEDDLVVDPDFFESMSAALLETEKNEEIWMVTGTRLMPDNPRGEWELLGYPVAWGWATTSEKWKRISSALRGKLDFSQLPKKSHREFWRIGHSRAIKGRIDAWDIPLAGAMVLEGKKCAIPPVNLVTNIGYDSVATHTKEKIWPLGLIRKTTPMRTNMKIDESTLIHNNSFYEDKVFSIRSRHQFIFLYAPIVQVLKNYRESRRPPLLKMVQVALVSWEKE